jgi:ABC-type nitrate/sulfonate/bicarbonate transport system permease component
MSKSIPWSGIFLIIFLIILWEVAMRASGIVTDSFAPPSKVFLAFVVAAWDGSMLKATGETLLAAVAGLAIGAGAGVLGGIGLGLTPLAARACRAPVETLRTLPSVALIPLSLMAFGFGYAMEYSIIAFATFWPTLILAQAAVVSVDRQLLDVARALQLGPISRVTKIVLPASMPRLVVALRLAIGVSLVVAVTIEIAANPQGLGYGLVIAQQSLHPDLMLAFLMWVGVLGWLLNRIIVEVEVRLLRNRGSAVAGRAK